MSAFVGEAARPPRCGWTPWIAAYLVFCVVVLVMVWYRASAKADATDFRDFWENALHFRQTGEIASDLGVHNYLPFFTILMTPWSFLPLQVAAVLFVALSLALFALTVWMCVALLPNPLPPREEAGGGFSTPLPPREGAGGGLNPQAAALIAAALMLPYVYACAVLGNVGLLLLFLIVTCWFLARRGHPVVAGAALGLATLIKLLPAALIVYFLLRRQWRVAAAAVATVLVLGLGWPLLSLGPSRTWREHAAFYGRAIQGHSATSTILADKPIKANFSNSALPVVLRRLLSPINGGKDSEVLLVNVANLPRPVILNAYRALLAGMVAASILVAVHGVLRRGGLAAARSDADDGWTFATWCCLMLLASPLVWTHYLPLVYWPLVAVVLGLLRDRQRGGVRLTLWLGGAVWLAGILCLAWPAARAAGAQLAAVFVLWLVSIVQVVWSDGAAGSHAQA